MLPLPVLAETDYMIRRRVGAHSARRLLAAVAAATYEVAQMSPNVLRRAIAFDERYADLDLGLADASVMAVAEYHDLPILTFDFAHFRATKSANGPWRLVVDEHQLAAAVKRR